MTSLLHNSKAAEARLQEARLTRIPWSTKIVTMKNVTISLEEEVARWARIWAAEHETSVSRLVGEMLREKMLRESEYDAAMRRFLSRKPLPLLIPGEKLPSREELHDRKNFR